MQQTETHLLTIENSVLEVPNELRISFLCGTKYTKDDKSDKRNILKNYLDKIPNNRTILLEKYFKNVRHYAEVGLYNLYDVETMVACFSNSVLIIHESLSTAAEIGMLTSDQNNADKTLVLYPDENSVEEEKISGFIHFAYYFGKNPILGENRKLQFDPLVKRVYTSNEKFTIHTYFPNDFQVPSATKAGIDNFLSYIDSSSISRLTFRNSNYEKSRKNKMDVIDYWQEGELLKMYLHPMSLRCLLFSLVSISTVRDHIESCTKVLDVVRFLEEQLKEILLQSTRQKLGLDVTKINLELKGMVLSTFHQVVSSDLRKAIGLFIFLLEAMDYLYIERNEFFKFTNEFKATRHLYESNVTISKDSLFKRHMDKALGDD